MKTRITRMLNIEYPIIQAGMSWASSCAALPAAVSNAGGLGVIAAGPMYEDDFRRVLLEVRATTDKPFGVNIPLYRPGAQNFLDMAYEFRVPVIFASQGGPKAHLARFQEIGTRWVHVVSTLEHAQKAADAGVDALAVVGTEAGGHPPVSGVSSLIMVRKAARDFNLPIIGGGGVADGYGVAAMLALGADAVQLGTRFLMTEEANVHEAYKAAAVATPVDGTSLVGRKGLPVRMLRNRFAAHMDEIDATVTDKAEYEAEFRKSTLKQAALDGDVAWGKVELGQSVGLVDQIQPVTQVMRQLVQELEEARRSLQEIWNVCDI